MPSPAADRPCIAVLVDTSTSWGRGIIGGIATYARQHTAWRLFADARGRNDPIELPPNWAGDGIIARVGDPAVARYLRATHLPVVNVSALQLPGLPFPQVATDVEAVGRMAAAYFLERGFRHFAYLSLLGLECVTRQHRAFAAAARAAGCTCAELGIEISRQTQSPGWSQSREDLTRWLQDLPKPVAILTWNGGQEVIDQCRKVGLMVPEEVALLSGSEDDLLCELCDIPISAVQQPVEQIGHEAAALLDRLLQGQKPAAQVIRLAPHAVISRRSTDTLAISDYHVSAALSFIRDNAHRPVRVPEVAAKVGVSRRVLERRFVEQLRRSPADYIRRSHLDLAKDLLTRTDRSLSSIAEACGFSSQQYLASILRQDTGMSPQSYRRQVRSKFS